MDRQLKNKLKRNIPLDYITAFITNLNMQSSVWVLYLAYCGLSLAEIGIVEGVYHATSIVFEIPSGAVADLLGRKRSMVCSRVCTAISCVAMLFARNFWLFAAGFAIQALGNNLNSGSEEALVYDSMKLLGQEEGYLKVCGNLDVIYRSVPGNCNCVRRHPLGLFLFLVLFGMPGGCAARARASAIYVRNARGC